MRKVFKSLLILLFIFPVVFLNSGCSSNPGQTDREQEEGPPGDPGGPGDPGDPGVDCWDLDADGVTDITEEDLNEDGVVNTLDCSARCWDINWNGIKDVATEDENGDGVVNIYDCKTLASGDTCIDEDGDGQCDVIDNTPQCVLDGTCPDVPIDLCEDVIVEPPPNCIEKVCPSYLASQGDPCCEKRAPTILNPSEYDCKTDACDEICTANCTCIQIAAEPDMCEAGFLIPGYYNKVAIEVSQCTQRWDVLTISDTYLRFDSLTGILKTVNDVPGCLDYSGGNIEISKYYPTGLSGHCATDQAKIEGVDFNFYNQARVLIDDVEYTWYSPAYDYFGFYEILQDTMDISEPIFVKWLDVSGIPSGGVAVPRVFYNYHRNGQLTYSMEYLFWVDPVYTTKFELYYKPLSTEE